MMSNVVPLNAWRGLLDQGEKGVKRNLTNLILHLQNLDGLGRELRYNELTNAIEWRGKQLEDADVIDIRLIIERAGFQPLDRDVRPAIDRVARDNPYNPVASYLTGLVWDGKPRLDRWMQVLMGAPSTEFVAHVGAKTLIAAVARALDPGCQVDTILVLEGEQGIRKSSAIAALFGPEYTRESVSLFDSHQRMVMNMMGAWAIELAEFVAIARNHHAQVKGMISMRRDTVVLPYAKLASTHPRRCVFFGTINPGATGYLTDDTGNRRYWPVPVTKIDLAGIKSQRDQLWAEAVKRYRAGERWWLEGDENAIAHAEQSKRHEDDAWVEPLGEKLADFKVVTMSDAFSQLGIPYDRRDDKLIKRMAAVLTELGFERETKRVDGRPRKQWARP